MTRFVHDQFAKQYLKELLAPLGEVETSRDVAGEIRQIDGWFSPAPEPTTDSSTLGLLGRFAINPCLIEPFRNPATPNEICNCLLKLLELRGELERQANRDNRRLQEDEYPKLWILTPTASAALLDGFRAILDQQNWMSGVYFIAQYLRTAIVVIHQLPRTEETLWLRILGKGNVQKQAIAELAALSLNNPLRSNALKLLTNLRANLQSSQNLDEEERELLMELSPLYVQWQEDALQEGEQRGMQLMLESMLQVKFGEIDEQLSQVIAPLMQLSALERTQMIMQLSREELLARFRVGN